MLSKTTEYALRAAVYLAEKAPSPQTAEDIAGATGVPGAYLSKVMQNLSRAGVVRSQRGLHGGFMLSQRPSGLTLLEIVNSVEPIRRFCSCPLDLMSHSGKLCPLHRKLDSAMAAVEEAFRETKLSDLLAEPADQGAQFSS